MENRSGLLVDACLTRADGHAERVAALHMIEPRADRPAAVTLGADKGYDAEDFVNELRSMNVTPHVAQNTSGRRSAIDGRTTRHGGYAVSQRIRKRIEEAFGWIKTVAGQEKTQVPRRRAGRLRLHLRRRSLRSGAAAEAPRRRRHDGAGKLPADRALAHRRGRHVGSRPSRSLRAGHDPHREDNHGEIAFGALQAGLDLSYSPSMVF